MNDFSALFLIVGFMLMSLSSLYISIMGAKEQEKRDISRWILQMGIAWLLAALYMQGVQ